MATRKGLTGSIGSKSSASSNQNSGAADEDMFLEAFESNLPKLQIFNARDLEDEFQAIKSCIENASLDWEKRSEAMRRLRSLICHRKESEEVIAFIRTLDQGLITSLKDLRSKVVRETCITIAYLCSKLGLKCDRLVELLLPYLVNLIQNSAKIMSSSGLVAMRFVIQHTHSPRFIPIITSNITSKSREIRKAVAELTHQMLLTWPTHSLDRHNALLQECIRKGMTDADADARSLARKAFWAYSSHYKEQSEQLLHSLDPSKQKILIGEQMGSQNGLSASLSSHSLPSGIASRSSSSSSIARSANSNNVRTISVNSTTNKITLNTGSAIGNSSCSSLRSGIPVISPKTATNLTATRGSPMRTTSAIDIGAARSAALRIKARYDTSAQNVRRKETLVAVTTTNASNGSSVAISTGSDSRIGRSKSRYSQSTPSSRSTSPSTKNNYITNLNGKAIGSSTLSGSNTALGTQRRRSGIPVLCSRETSPTRHSSVKSLRTNHSHETTTSTECLNQKNSEHLQQMLTRNDFVDAFNSIVLNSNRPARRLLDDHSDESETSSVCSDMSFTSNGHAVDDAGEIIRNLSSAHWSDRKEGLLGLRYFLRQSTRRLTNDEVKKITDIFTKMLVDPHTKTYSFFLEFLREYLMMYKNELRNWLFIVMTRLLLRLGTDLLGSVQAKIVLTLETIQRSFTHTDQFNVIIRFLNDQTQTPTVKSKILLLHYLHSLLGRMQLSEWNLAPGNDLRVALMKIIAWTDEPKSAELRKMAQEVLLDLYSLNTLEYLHVLKQLPTYYQDTACASTQTRRRSSNNDVSSDIVHLVCNTTTNTSTTTSTFTANAHFTLLSSPAKVKSGHTRDRIGSSRNDVVDTVHPLTTAELMNSEQVYHSLKETTDEIQKYISSMGTADHVLGNGDGKDVYVDFLNGCDSSESKFKRVFEKLSPETGCTVESQKQAYNTLLDLINNANEHDWNANFKDTLSLLLDKVQRDPNAVTRAYSLKILCELLHKRSRSFSEYIELTMLRILEANRDSEKEVQRAAELCAGTAATVLPGDQTIRILKAVISTSTMPVNLAAIKMLTKVVEKQSARTVNPLLNELMPVLIQAYDDLESAIRKAAVFCMVAIYNCVGDEMDQYISSLSPSKMKLLRLYIDRSKVTSSGSSSPVSLSAASRPT